ncbi:MAG TPA: N-acetylneuraminate synthase [Elusimicrobia bacterium]|nr:N-acetylneuraminate synthase [Elusimicrobiota bacterium]
MANKTIKLAGHEIGEKKPVFLIAEIGINHNGSLETAKKLIDASFACNWHCVKFQKRTPDICVPEKQKGVLRDTPWGKITYLDYRHKVEFQEKEYAYIDKYCAEKPVMWTASAWDIPSLEFLLKRNVPFVKIPSAKMTEDDFVREAAKSGVPVVLSTGMSTVEEMDHAVELLEKSSKGDYVLMHTNSAYPAAHEDLNLNVMGFLKERYKCLVGYSGHEYDLEPTVIAAVLGAVMVERHVTLAHDMWGSDHFASLEVHAMDLLAKRIKSVSAIIGDGIKRMTPKETEARNKLRGY